MSHVEKVISAKRIKVVLAIILVLGFGVSIFRIGQISLAMGEELQTKAIESQLSDITLSAKRGTIYDSNGTILAQSATVWKVVLVPVNFETEAERTIVVDGLAEILEDVDKDHIRSQAEKNWNYAELKGTIEPEVKAKVLEFVDKIEEQHNIRGVISLVEDYKRYNPYSTTAAAVLGFTGTDSQGLNGLELQYDEQLTGTPGRIVKAVNANGTDMPLEHQQKVDAEDGYSIVSTIDLTIQNIVEKYVRKGVQDNSVVNRGVGVAMNPQTGEILALAVEDSFDPNDPFTIYNEATKEQVEAIENDEEREKAYNEAINKQWRNKAVSDTYYPGSVFKIMSAAMVVEEGAEASSYSCSGSYKIAGLEKAIGCHKRTGHGSQTFMEAFCNSCNPAFIQMGYALGRDTFKEYYDSFGFSESTGIDLPGEAQGIWFSNFTDINLATASFGQNFSVTPIQMVAAISATVNGGYLMQPRMVKQIVDSDGNVIENYEPEVKRQVVSEETSKKMRDMLYENVENGAAKNAYISGYKVGGKTGTSEKNPERDDTDYISSFCGIAPADNPEIVLLLYFDTPTGEQYYGSQVAAPVFANIMTEVLPYMNTETFYTDEELDQLGTVAKEYTGLSVAEAKKQVENDGFEVAVKGGGDTVIMQIPEANSRLPQDGTVVLYTDTESTSDANISVPDLVGKTMAEAKSILKANNLNISIVGTSSDEGIVQSQDISANTKVSEGSVITVTFVIEGNYGDGIM